jgi:hypothetical protein
MKCGEVSVQEAEELSALEECIVVVSFVRLLVIVLMMLLVFMDCDCQYYTPDLRVICLMKCMLYYAETPEVSVLNTLPFLLLFFLCFCLGVCLPLGCILT